MQNSVDVSLHYGISKLASVNMVKKLSPISYKRKVVLVVMFVMYQNFKVE